MIIPLVEQYNETRARSQSAGTVLNWFPVSSPVDDEYPYILYPTPGLTSWTTISGANVIRGLYEQNNKLYVVADDTFYQLDTDKNATSKGTLSTTTGRVQIASIDDEIVIVDGLKGYHYKISTDTFTEITDADFNNTAVSLTSQDGYFIVTKPDSAQFYISNLNDGTAWEALDFASAVGKPDYLFACYSHRRYLWLFGKYTTEIWYNSGNADFPFEKQNGIFIEYGISATSAISEAANQLYWVGQNRAGEPLILRSEGFSPKVISTAAINYQLSTFSTVSDAFAFSYTQEGHEFVVFSFPTANKTFVFDVTTEAWHERNYFNGTNYVYHIANNFARFNNKPLVGSRLDNNIFELDLSAYTDNGNRIKRKLVSPHLDLDMRRASIYNFQIRTEPGVGTTSGDGSDPQLVLRISKDFGNTWSNEMWRSPGKKGEYLDRCLWTRLGMGRSFTFEVSSTDPVEWIIHGARADIEVTKD